MFIQEKKTRKRYCVLSNCMYFFIACVLRIYDVGYTNIIYELYFRVAFNLIMSDVQPHHTYATMISQIV